MALQIFDIDQDLLTDSATRDLKEVYNEEAINQSIDIWISVPYRIGVGYKNNLLSQVFTDIGQKTNTDIIRDIKEEFENNYQMIVINSIVVNPDSNNRKLYIKLDWRLRDYPISGNYIRYWEG